MNSWAANHPDEMDEIARLPLPQQNEALRGAVAPSLVRAAEHYTGVLDEARALPTRVLALDSRIAEEQAFDAATRMGRGPR